MKSRMAPIANVATTNLRITSYVRTPNGANQNSQITWKSTDARLYVIETNTNPDMSPLSWVDSGLGTLYPRCRHLNHSHGNFAYRHKTLLPVRAFRPLP